MTRSNILIAFAILTLAGPALRAADDGPSVPAHPRTFADITADAGVAALLDDKYKSDAKWWLSGIDLIDLDGDGHLDLFLGSHGGGSAMAALNDGKGHFTRAQGVYPDRELYVAADINGDGKLDMMITHQDGAGRWWINESSKGKLSFR